MLPSKSRLKTWRLPIIAAAAFTTAWVQAEQVTGINVDGQLTDWGVHGPDDSGGGFTQVVNASNDLYSWGASQGAWTSGDDPNPNGGQNYDAEALYSGYDTGADTLYIALVTGFDIQGEDNPLSNPWRPGDIFVDFGQDGSYELAFDVSSYLALGSLTTLNAYDVTGGFYSLTPQTPGGSPGGPLPAGSNQPFEINTGTATSVGTASFFYDDNAWGGTGDGNANDHNVYELAFNLSGFSAWLDEVYSGSGGNGYTVHWTMGCGNDDLQLNVAPVPLPGALLLGLTGVAGLPFLRKRRKA